MQQLWQTSTGWDQPPPRVIVNQWKEYQDELKYVKELGIPRCVNMEDATAYQLHVFSDASNKAYATAIYLRCMKSTSVQVRLIACKTRVAPLKAISLPRLELCGALMSAELAQAILTSLEDRVNLIQAWTDSEIVIAWIKKEDLKKTPTFERNRIVKIQNIICAAQWAHVPGKINPADSPSRGISVQQLLQDPTWFNGPSFLYASDPVVSSILLSRKDSQKCVDTPSMNNLKVGCNLTLTTSVTTAATEIYMEKVWKRYSDWNKLKRHVAWLIKIFQFKKTTDKSITFSHQLTQQELQRAEERIVLYLQKAAYASEIESIQRQGQVTRKSKLLPLNPFLDSNNLIRVGGRLRFSRLVYTEKHPLVLPRHHVTELIVKNQHMRLLHGGNQATLAMLQRRFWIIRARSVVRRVIGRCKTCTIYKAESPNQLMADLPTRRVNQSRPFSHVGVDLAGPVILRDSIGRSPKTHKAYICLFVCFSTKAVHLELVSSMSTEAFLAALRRMVSRRGLPQSMHSDNGSNFIGANRELQEFIAFTLRNDVKAEISKTLAKDNIEWLYNPPGAPHMGGLWEAAVKSTKFHLSRVLGKTPLTFEEYCTLLCEVEAILNSRPICPLTPEPEDFEALTPGHFIIGNPLISIPEADWTEVKVNRLSRWQHQQQIKQHFWKRWSQEYLQHLQKRTKWRTINKNVNIGDMVVIREENQPPLKWKLARIVEIHTNPEDEKKLVRTVSVKTQDGIFKRPITKLVILPAGEEDEEES